MAAARANHFAAPAAAVMLFAAPLLHAADGGFAALAREAGMEAYAVPLKAPGFVLRRQDGATRAHHDYAGRVVLVNFWGSWCPPCRHEFPSLQRLQESLGGPEFTVLAIAVADNAAAVDGFLGGRPAGFDILFDDDRKTAADYRAAGVPVTYLLDRKGRLLAGKSGPLQWDGAAIQRLIRKAIHPDEE